MPPTGVAVGEPDDGDPADEPRVPPTHSCPPIVSAIAPMTTAITRMRSPGVTASCTVGIAGGGGGSAAPPSGAGGVSIATGATGCAPAAVAACCSRSTDRTITIASAADTSRNASHSARHRSSEIAADTLSCSKLVEDP